MTTDKYDFEFDMNDNSAISKIIRRIQPNSKVLEFGPAHGRLTKYMKEQLKCDCSIVELDKDAFKDASQYADYALLGDIEDYEWVSDFSAQAFDYIIFADVLEHLRDPFKVMEVCRDLLKDTGILFVSVPNVGHNAILLNLLENKFEYTSTGLLDDTHIHFFARDTVVKYAKLLKYFIVYDDATYAKPKTTEFTNDYDSRWDVFNHLIEGREYGEVYQFVFGLSKVERGSNVHIRPYNSSVYLQVYQKKVNDSYSDIRSRLIELDLSKKKYRYELPLDIKDGECIRVDLINLPSIIRLSDLLVDKKKIEYETNGFELSENVLLFSGTDAIVEFTSSSPNAVLEIEFELLALGSDIVDVLSEGLVDIEEKNSKTVSELEGFIKIKDRYIDSLNRTLTDKNKIIADQIVSLEVKNEFIDSLKNTITEKDKIYKDDTLALKEIISDTIDKNLRLRNLLNAKDLYSDMFRRHNMMLKFEKRSN